MEELLISLFVLSFFGLMGLIPVAVLGFGRLRQRVWRRFANEHGFCFERGFPVVGSPCIEGDYRGVRVKIRVKRNWFRRIVRRRRANVNSFAETHYEVDLRHITPPGMTYEGKHFLPMSRGKTIMVGITAVDQAVTIHNGDVHQARAFFDRPGVQRGFLRLLSQNGTAHSTDGMLRIYHPFIAAGKGTLKRNLDAVTAAGREMLDQSTEDEETTKNNG